MSTSQRLLRPAGGEFSPQRISGLALWLDGGDSSSLYTTDAGPVEAVSSPLDISGCQLWLDCSRTDKMYNATTGGSLVADGDPVLRLEDLSGNGKHLIQATSGSAPLRDDASLNGLTTLDLAGTKHGTSGAAGDWNFLHNTTGGTVITVLKPFGSADPQTFAYGLATNFAGPSSGIGWASFFDDRVSGYSRNNYASSGVQAGVSGQVVLSIEQYNAYNSADAFSLFSYTTSCGAATAAGRGSLHLSGSQIGNTNTQTLSPSASNSNNGFVVGGVGSNGIYGVAEIIVYDTALTASQRASVELYLATKWGIGGIHRSAASEQEPVNSPEDIDGLEAWYDFSEANSYTLDGSGRVTAVSPVPGHGETLTCWVPAQYTPVIGEVNGLLALEFEAGHHYQGLLRAGNNAYLTSKTPLTIFCVAWIDRTYSATAMPLYSKDHYLMTNQARYEVGYYGQAQNKYRQFFKGDLASIDTSIIASKRNDTEPVVHVASFTSGDFAVYDESTKTYSSATAVNSASVAEGDYPFTIGGSSAGGSFSGKYCEIIAYRRKLSDSERQRVELYLSQKWRSVDPLTPTPPVGYWKDKSGNNRHATQATAASRPTVGSQNGRTALTFDGSADYLSADGAATVFDGTDAPWTVLAAIDMNSTANSVPWSVSRNDLYSSRYLARIASGTWSHLFTDQGSVSKTLSTGTPVSLDPSILTVTKHGATATISVLGAPVLAGADASGTQTSTRFTIGAHNNLGGVVSFSSVTGLELLAYNRALTTSERRRVESYLARRWGIALAPQVSNVEAQDWINRVYAAGSTVSQPVANAVSAFVDGCQADGIWDAMKSVVLLAGADTLAGALAPLKGTAPTSYNFVSGDYSKTSGLVGNGSTKYLDSNRAGNADPQDSSHAAIYGTTLTQSSQWIGSEGASVKNQGLAWYSPYFYFNNHGPNPGNQRVSTAFVSSGFAGTSRSGATDTAARYGGSDFTDATASATPSSENLAVFAYNDSGVITAHSASRISFYSIGESLDLALLDARVSALMTNLGVS
jgi:hypothetical protein